MTLKELGIILRTEREKRQLSVDDVAQRLKISPKVLRALESGDEGGLPPAVYARGFIRSYTVFLGLEAVELEFNTHDTLEEENTLAPTEYSIRPPTSAPWKKFFLICLLVACCSIAGVYWYTDDDVFFSSIPQIRLTTNATHNPEQTKDNPLNDTQQDARPMQAAKESAASTPVATTPPAIIPAPTQEIAPIPTKLTNNKTAANTQTSLQHKVIITALAECWVHSNADNADTRQFALRKGDTFALTFTNKLTLKLGNAGGVRIRYDGEDLPLAGKEGQVRTITFPPTE